MKTFKHLVNSVDVPRVTSNEIETRTGQPFQYQDNPIVVKPAFKCIHECCKQLRKSEMFQLGHLMDSVTLIGSNTVPFKYNSAVDTMNYQFSNEWNKVDEPLDLSIHKVVRS